MPLALLFALLLNRRLRLMSVWRFSLFYPALLPLIGAASIWAFLFSDTSRADQHRPARRWACTASTGWATRTSCCWTVIVINIWKQTGYFMIFYLAGLQNIPKDFYEAAELDGANEWQKLIRLTLPLLRRTTLFVLVIAFTFAFQTVEQLQVLGQGESRRAQQPAALLHLPDHPGAAQLGLRQRHDRRAGADPAGVHGDQFRLFRERS